MIKKEEAIALFRREFTSEPTRFFFSHGRVEIIGNHTDHNKGQAIVGGVDLGISAAVNKTEGNFIRIVSEGYPMAEIDLNEEIFPRMDEKGKSVAFIRGVLGSLQRLGYKIGGFEAALVNDIKSGSGVSSSACYSSLICGLVNNLFNQGKISKADMILASQYAEVIYYGKPCGSLDQTGCIYGGVAHVDFAKNGEVTPLPYHFPFKNVLIISKQSHDQGGDYGSIPADMRSVAKNVFGVEVLGDIDDYEFRKGIALPSVGVTELAKLRATHFFDENKRVFDAKNAIIKGDMATFVKAINESGNSSSFLLQNTMIPGKYEGSQKEIVDVLRPFVKEGAIRMMGGGYGGSVIAFLLPTDYEAFLFMARRYFGNENVLPISLLEGGVIEI